MTKSRSFLHQLSQVNSTSASSTEATRIDLKSISWVDMVEKQAADININLGGLPVESAMEDSAVKNVMWSFHNNNVILDEHWESKYSVHIYGRVERTTTDFVDCTCLIDRTKRVFELRRFQRYLVDHIPNVEKGKLLYFQIRSKPGSFRINIYDGSGMAEDDLFNLDDQYKKIEGQGLDKPFEVK